MLNLIKEEVGSDSPSIRTLCPTRWTVRANSLSSVLANYEHIQTLWEEALSATTDTEMKARIRGVSSQMTTFQFFFGLVLSELILQHTDQLSKTLQNPDLSSMEGHYTAMLTVKTLQTIRTEADFNLFWKKAEMKRLKLNIDEPQLPRRRKIPKRFEQGTSVEEYPDSVESLYRQVYFEAIDLAMNSIKSRFDQEGFKVYSNIEQLLLKALMGKVYEKELEFVCNFYGDDFNRLELEAQLKVLRTLYSDKYEDDEQASVRSLKAVLQDLSLPQRSLIDEVCLVFKLLLVMPATNCTSERSFSAIRQIKRTYEAP